LGAAELVMPIDEFLEKAKGQYSLRNLEALASHFGTSLEATAYRLATAHPGFAVAGLLRLASSGHSLVF
jgi:Zn-dependent peptidase ImmA (M78 family)